VSDLYKFGWMPSGQDDEPYEYANVWVHETTDRIDRLSIATRSAYVSLLQELAFCIEEPFWLLYVLVVPRGGGEAGRYLSEQTFSFAQLRNFLSEFSAYLQSDGRHNLWIRSASGDGLLVYDRHNIIYAYGPLDQYIQVLRTAGLAQSDDQSLHFASPHSHHYHAEFDESESRLLSEYTWEVSPLRPGDENPY
jgi:hypothetical protein